MRFTVVWDQLPLDDLTNLWMAALDQQAVADAADAIDRLLRDSPTTVGAQVGPFRRLRVDPLEVDYAVSPADCLVTVTALRRVP
jgi:hypothetical protein